jgi:hypothetical protein
MRFAGRGPCNPGLNLMELRTISEPDKQSCNNILLHVYLEGNCWRQSPFLIFVGPRVLP